MKNKNVRTCLILTLILAAMIPVFTVYAANPKPGVIPSLREWTGGAGSFTVTSASRICVDPAYATTLSDTANALKEDLTALNGLNLTVVNTSSPSAGDFYLTLNCTDAGLGAEGYLFEVGNTLTLRANSAKGVFYGTRTALQILKQDAGMDNIPQGTARDYPKWKERGFMLDVGRMFFTMATLRDYAKFMGWYKMNDFQLHLNDNGFDNVAQYSAFRLESTSNPGLTATDGSYTKTELIDLQNLAAKYGVTITPEFDTPAHSGALTKYRPDLMGQDWTHLDIFNTNLQPFINTLWDEYVPIFQTNEVHMGCDEYKTTSQGSNDKFREYMNNNNRYLKSKGKTARMWGGLDYYPGTVAVDTDIIINCWYNGYYNPKNAIRDGHKVINTNDADLYIVPKAGYYHDFLDCQFLFNSWEPWYFGGTSYNLSPTEPNLLGGMFCVWNDKLGANYNDHEVYDRVKPAMQTLAEKLWSGVSGETWTTFNTRSGSLGNAPGTDLEGSPQPSPSPIPGNLAAGRPAYSSSNETSTLTADKAVDNSMATRWASLYSDPQWLYVDLGQAYNVNRVRVYWEAAYGKSYKIQVSNDATNWTDAYSTTTGDGGMDDVNFTAKSGRYVRMYGTVRGSGYGYSIYEFEVYDGNGGTPAPSPTPTLSQTPTATRTPTPTITPTSTPGANGVAWWKFDEGSGTVASDSWGTNTGTVSGPSWVTGKYGNALSFDGKNDVVNINKTDISTPWTAAMWVNRTDSTASASALLSSSGASIRVEQYNGTNKVGYTKPGVADYVFNYTAPTGIWVHLAFVGASSGVSLYVNGEFQETNAGVINCPMGWFGKGATSDWLKGKLDEVKIYNRALSAGEIAALAQ